MGFEILNNSTKVYVSKKNTYFLVGLSIIYITCLTIFMLWDILNTNVNQKSNAIRIWLIQYLTTAGFLALFVIYTIMSSIERVSVGILYVLTWIIIWFGFAFGRLIVIQKFIALDGINITLFVLALIGFFFIIKDIFELKRIKKYEKMKKRQYKL
ncbi:hypothetical protein MFERI14815_00676 [Mycoplasma feriruminatoris]|uniref:hypothetical protein n=1 Tax=Mycoplasma feriruminatoris TaxID=1179777 RepID=UPI00241E61B7|nr:hypothetical protein [Mycoplasma feriruminatoris]WFQ92060.1 hypothetical protein MFERI14815_00676 [Mycoplasma feriruminatoris]